MKNLTVYVLSIGEGEYDEYNEEIKGITTNSRRAHAWGQLGVNKSESYIMEAITLNVMDKHFVEMIDTWMDPQRNPMCVCGHPLLHHRSKGKGSCFFNSPYAANRHKCKGFQLALDMANRSCTCDGGGTLCQACVAERKLKRLGK